MGARQGAPGYNKRRLSLLLENIFYTLFIESEPVIIN